MSGSKKRPKAAGEIMESVTEEFASMKPPPVGNELLVKSLEAVALQQEADSSIYHGMEMQNPHLCLQVLQLLSEGDGYKLVERKLGVPRETVRDIKRRHEMAISEHKKLMRVGAAMAVDASHNVLLKKLKMLMESEEDLRKCSLKDIAMAWGISFDKSQITQDQPTSIQRNEGGMTVDDMKAYHEKLMSEIPEAEAVEVENGA